MMKTPAKKFLALFAILTAAALLVCSAAVVIVDPFFRYHAPLNGFPYVVDNQLTQNIGIAELFPYDSVIAGSSMTMNFDTNDFTTMLPSHPHPVKLTMNGAMPADIHRVLTAAFSGPNEIREVYVAIDPNTWTAEDGTYKYPYPEYLYDRNPFNDVRYLWNMDVLLDYCLRPMAEREPTDLTRVWMTDWEEDMYYTLDWILSHYEEPAAVPEETAPDAYLDDTLRNLNTTLLPLIDAHPETKWTFFFAPYSVLYWHNVMQENHLDATLAQEIFLTEALLEKPNTRVFLYQDIEEIITNMDGGYMDDLHFRPEVNTFMVSSMASGEYEITDPAQMRERLEKFREMLIDYDFSPILP